MEEKEKKYKDWSEMTDEELDASMPEPRPQNRYEEEALENREKRKRRAEAFRDFFYENLWQRKHADDMLDFCQKLTKLIEEYKYDKLDPDLEISKVINSDFLRMLYIDSVTDLEEKGMVLAKEKIDDNYTEWVYDRRIPF